IVGLGGGGLAERAHLAKLSRREERVRDVFVSDIGSFPGGVDPTTDAAMVMGETVIATDYFKSFLAKLRKVFGGELGAYRSLMVRARREAVVQMLEQAKRQGCDAVCNVRLDPADLGGTGVRSRGMTTVAIVATGTAYRRRT
ncbi:MAG: heavy metal-binding domain-containing protein, partial [Planctomycetes bacterium]|nr:heavy metal-binding domain-containing protein [Planctomycetota bacterium]